MARAWSDPRARLRPARERESIGGRGEGEVGERRETDFFQNVERFDTPRVLELVRMDQERLFAVDLLCPSQGPRREGDEFEREREREEKRERRTDVTVCHTGRGHPVEV